MSTLRILHTADLHLDSAFEGLPAGKAAIRRREQRELLQRLADLVREESIDLVLLSGDLFDAPTAYYETQEQFARCLRQMAVPVFIAPGNHDFYSDHSVYAQMPLPSNVRIFRKNTLQYFELDRPCVRVYGAAFTDKNSRCLLPEGFTAEKQPGRYDLLCLHGEVDAANSVYSPVTSAALAGSGLDYAAFGHVHAASGLRHAGKTAWSWPGCPEGRGFDETGVKTVSVVELTEEGCTLTTRVIASRKYEILPVDVSGSDPLLAVHAALPDDTVRDVYRIVLTGECEAAPDLNRLQDTLGDLFFALQLRDQTKISRDIWEKCGEDTLKGIFLKKLRTQYDNAPDDRTRRIVEQAVRWGLAAMENGEEAVHDN